MSRRPTSPDADLARWCAALSAEVVTDEVPPGWLTTKDIAAKLGKGQSTVGAQLGRAVAAGTCERRNFRIRTGSIIRPVPHYRPMGK
jgi:predicted transcriptional regulator